MKKLFSRLGSLIENWRKKNKERRAKKTWRQNSGFDRQLLLKIVGRRFPNSAQLKHLPRYLSDKEKTIITLLSTVIFVSLVIIGSKFILSHIEQTPANGGSFIEASIGGPRFINPILASNNDTDLDIVRLVFSGLMRTNSHGELVPDLAASYTMSDDGKIYTFNLQPDILWQDGNPFTANDVAATINYIKSPDWKSPLITQFKNIDVETPDDRTVVFHLKEPFAPFLSLLTVGILPEHLWQDVLPENAGRAELNIKPVGTGPFRFKSLTKDKNGMIHSYTLSRYDDYKGAQPFISEITFVYYPDTASATQALIDKKVDSLNFLPLDYHDIVDQISSLRIYNFKLPEYTAIFFNQTKNSALKNKSVRQALAQALDKDEIVTETLGSAGTPVYGPILPGFIGFYADIKKYQPDILAATKLLNDAGYKIGEDGLRGKTTSAADKKSKAIFTPLTITLTTVDMKENFTAAQIIKRSWEKIGVKTELEIVPATDFQQSKIHSRNYEALLYGEIIGPDPDPYPFWHSSQSDAGGLNLASFNNRRADELLEQARVTADADKRTAFYRQFQDILAEEIPAIFLYSPTYSYAVDRRIQGIDSGVIFTPADRFAEINKWYIKTKKVWQ